MWADETLSTLKDSQNYSRSMLYGFLKKSKAGLSVNSFNWIIADLEKRNVLYKTGTDSYSKRKDERKDYRPEYSETAGKLLDLMKAEYPELSFAIFETFLLNEFVNHMISKNIIVIQIEKDLVEFVFEFLNEKFPGKVLFKPKTDDLFRYQSPGCIIIENIISEAPVPKDDVHSFTIEKLLVDCVADKIIPQLFSSGELSLIFQTAAERYKVDLNKLKRYASRRSAWNEVKKLLDGENQ